MRYKDLKVGMEVARRAPAYLPDQEPTRYVVVSLDYTVSGYRYRHLGRPEVPTVTLTVPAALTGTEVEAEGKFLKPYLPGDQRNHVVLAFVRETDGTEAVKLTVVPVREIEGPYQEVKTKRDEARKARQEREAIARDRADEEKRRFETAAKSLYPLIGPIARNYRNADVTITLDQVEELVEHLRQSGKVA